ncbi:hypothetical protein [Streptomyces sp. NPDC057545]|uniref:hypothetical protein n=1 Tax=Streptomyces sp. NPDC057545 TaxID=3346164 RepID=UPI0036B0F032
MPLVVGLLEQRKLVARRRVDELREEADRIQAELAERDWKEWTIARSRVGEVLAPADETDHGRDQGDRTAPTADGQAEEASSTLQAAKAKSQVPVWREGLAWSALSVDYQRILRTLADRSRLGQGPMTCQEMAAVFGMDVVPARVEALRSKAKRLVARGWLAEPAPGRCMLVQGVSGPGGGS